MLLMEAFVNLLVILLILFVFACVMKYRQSILDWIIKPPQHRASSVEMEALKTLEYYGIDNAAEVIRSRKDKREQDEAIITKTTEAETGE